ncbi:cytochrome P450 [Rhizodiscina lignyota]|uniref:Cytochrome P450 n=1 Tax=Rhizodiscina lignyota TaxID=1504668 RepID=A0A9P4M5Z0_9PEZI|nr:cytochrome P450 [Rhizodiscina lignyota]
MFVPIARLLATHWLSLTALAVTLYFARNYFRKGLNKYPGPFLAAVTNWWRFYFAYKRRPEREFQRLHDRHGDIVRIGPNMLSFSDPEALKTIYALNNGFVKSRFYHVHQPMVQGKRLESVFTATNEAYHAQLRRCVANAFSMTQVLPYEARVDKTSRVFLEETERTQANTGRALDFTFWLQLFAFDVVTEIAFSKTPGFVKKGGDVEGILAALEKWFRYVAKVGQIPALDILLYKNPVWTWLHHAGWTDNTHSFARWSKARIDERRRAIEAGKAPDEEATVQSGDLLTQFLKIKEARPDFFTDARIEAAASSITVAGSDTTAISLAAVFYNLLKNPSTYQKLNEELEDAAQRGIVPKSPAEIVPWGATQQLPYLDACIKEGFRIHAAIAFNLERVVPPQGATICGEFIPGGTVVGCNAWVIHKRREIFGDDVDTYRPERWFIDPQKNRADEEARINKMSSTLFHFGAGARSCLGRYISLLEMYKIIPSFLRNFDIHLVNPDAELKLRNAWFIKPLNFDVTITSKTATVNDTATQGVPAAPTVLSQ